MYDLDAILNEVRTKYYCSENVNSPTISWSNDFWTDFFGVYTAYNNHITISRILNDKRVTYDMLSSVVYHESLHQDFPEHNRSFKAKADLFSNYVQLNKELTAFAEMIHAEIEYPKGYNNFTENKKKVVYILLPQANNYTDALMSRDGTILVDFDSRVAFDTESASNEDLYIFLAENKKKYWIVGWCTNGILLPKKKIELLSKFGDYDVSYQLMCKYKDMYLLPVSTCTYAIGIDGMGEDFQKHRICQYCIDEPIISEDLSYIESYCEGYFNVGFDPDNMSSLIDYKDIPLNKIRKLKETSYADVWKANYIVNKEPTAENFAYRAECKQNAWLNSSAMDDYIMALSLEPDNYICAGELIKLSAITSRLSEGVEYIKSYDKFIRKDDIYLNNAIEYILSTCKNN